MKYAVKKIAVLIFTLILVSIITFIAFNILPGDYATTSLGVNASPEEIDEYNAKLGLDRPATERYFSWIGNLLKGDLGTSFSTGRGVGTEIIQSFPATLVLTFFSLFIILIFSVLLGIFSAKHEHSFLDNSIMTSSFVVMSIPNFFIGLVASWFFGVTLGWFSPSNYIGYDENFIGFLQYLILPAFAIALPKIGMTAKFMRTSVIEQKNAGYVRTAKGIGLKPNEIMYKHILKNAFLPVVTFLGIITTELIAGSVIIEQIFQIRGIGRLLLNALSKRDIPLAQGTVLFIAFMVILINFAVDMIYKSLDPRVRT